jgi:methylmalonyl-CoA/ethylmalonyl-CoA epimerase
MNPTHVEHIGIAVKDLGRAIGMYETLLGVKCYKIEAVEEQGVRTAFFRVGQTKIELLESLTPDGPLARFLERRGEGVHHIALAVENLPGALKELVSKGVPLIDTEAREGADGGNIAFLHPKAGGGVLIELCEHRPNE